MKNRSNVIYPFQIFIIKKNNLSLNIYYIIPNKPKRIRSSCLQPTFLQKSKAESRTRLSRIHLTSPFLTIGIDDRTAFAQFEISSILYVPNSFVGKPIRIEDSTCRLNTAYSYSPKVGLGILPSTISSIYRFKQNHQQT